ncbi:MAG: hypothetical protein FJZ90_16775 [Chloroflexi bacterium]|nr:hypothetical protein [Chloroflexota bacterium]
MSVIDTLSAGFNATARKLWLLVIPVVLDVFLWLGPKLSIAPIIDRTITILREGLQVAAPSGGDATARETFEATMEMLRETLGRTNLFALLAWGRLGMPSVASTSPINPENDQIISVSGIGPMLLLQAVIMAAGLLVACLFLVLLGCYAQGATPNLRRLPHQVLNAWLYMALIYIPFGFVLVFALSFSLLIGPLSVFVGVFFLWILLYISFVPQAISLGEENPLRALVSSFTVVRLNFWATLGLIALINVINTGLGLVWYRVFMRTAVGTLVAIVANAYVGTSLTFAAFYFYQDRLSRWHRFIQQQQHGSA